MVGITLANPEAKAVQKQLMAARIIVNAVGDTILRCVPPLVVTQTDCDRVVEALRSALSGS
jgi:acetylornithine/succinyldiaminopimelate/putrescine aminotransferase